MNVPPPVDVIPLRAENQRDDSENLNLLRGGFAFSTWLYRVAVNTVLMKLRRKSPPVLSLDEPVSGLAISQTRD
jgi:DNA-directed RNA polymerase specialized sigma24 family protein